MQAISLITKGKVTKKASVYFVTPIKIKVENVDAINVNIKRVCE